MLINKCVRHIDLDTCLNTIHAEIFFLQFDFILATINVIGLAIFSKQFPHKNIDNNAEYSLLSYHMVIMFTKQAQHNNKNN